MINNLILNSLFLLPKSLVKVFANTYVAGIKIDEVLETAQNLNDKGFKTTIDLLGEHTKSIDEAKNIINTYTTLLKKINILKLDSNISVKPTHIGLDVDEDIFYQHALSLIEEGEKYHNFIRFDMENSSTTDQTIDIYSKIYHKYKNTGIVLQAYLRRSYDDIKALSNYNNINFRLCKGIYNEKENIAYQSPEEINKNYLKITEYAFKNNLYICLATHDLHLIEEIYLLIKKYNVSKSKFEFQVLYGVPMKNWLKTHQDNGYQVRGYIPFGPQWYEYSIRRLKENPNIMKYVLKNLFSKRNY